MKTANVSEIRNVLLAVSGATPVGLSALLPVKAKKTGNPFAAIAKLSKVTAFTGFSWENSVNRQLGREGKEETFQEGARSWGERIAPALVQNGEEFYLVAKVERTAKPVYLAKRKEGEPWRVVAKEVIAAFLPPSRPAPVGTDKELFYRNFKLSNITRLAIGGEVYRVR